MFSRRNATWALIYLATFLSLGAVADPPSIPVDMSFATLNKNPHVDLKGNPDRQGSYYMQFIAADPKDIKQIVEQAKAVLPEFDADHPPIVPFYIAKHRSPAEQKALVEEAKAALKDAFPGIEPIIRVHFVDDGNDDVRNAAKILNDKVDEAAAQVPQDDITKDGVAKMHEAAEAAMKDTVDAIREEQARNMRSLPAPEETLPRPTWSQRFFKRAAKIRAALAFTSRSVQVGSTAALEPGSLVAGVALIGFDSAWEYFYGRYEMRVAKLFVGNPLRVNEEKHPFLARLAPYYTNIRYTACAMATSGIGRPAFANLLAHLSAPAAVPLFYGAQATAFGVSIPKYAMLGTISFLYSTFYYAGLRGTEGLRQKGWVDGPWAEFMLRGPSFAAMLAGLGLSMPYPLSAISPVLFGTVWLIWATTFVVHKMLPPRTDKIILVDSALAHYREQIQHREGAEFPRVTELNEEDVQKALREVSEAPLLFPNRRRADGSAVPPTEGGAKSPCGEGFAYVATRKVGAR